MKKNFNYALIAKTKNDEKLIGNQLIKKLFKVSLKTLKLFFMITTYFNARLYSIHVASIFFFKDW